MVVNPTKNTIVFSFRSEPHGLSPLSTRTPRRVSGTRQEAQFQVLFAHAIGVFELVRQSKAALGVPGALCLRLGPSGP